MCTAGGTVVGSEGERSLSTLDVVAQEMHGLREELRDLKGYQFRLVSIAALITGFLLSLTRIRLDAGLSVPPSQSLYLLPLIVVLPSWCIFFDKTKTITRIVGYCRLLEAILNKEREEKYFAGWERSLGRFRKKSADIIRALKGRKPAGSRTRSLIQRTISDVSAWARNFTMTVLLIESQRYWTLAYATFLTLSTVCLWVPIRLRYPIGLQAMGAVFHLSRWEPDSFLLTVALGLTAYCAVFNGVVLSRLMWGQHSYDFMEEVWKQVLSVSSEGPVEKKGTR